MRILDMQVLLMLSMGREKHLQSLLFGAVSALPRLKLGVKLGVATESGPKDLFHKSSVLDANCDASDGG